MRTLVLYAARLPTSPDQIVAYVEANAREPIDVEYLLVWIARRTDRAIHQAGERSPLERLRFACHNWLSAEERDQLVAWLERRVAADQSIRPPLPGRRG